LPSVRLAVWTTEALLREFGVEAGSPLLDALGRPRLVADWALALRSPGVALKATACRMLASMANEFGPGVRAEVLDVLDEARVRAMARALVARGGTGQRAMHSRLTLGLVELVALW